MKALILSLVMLVGALAHAQAKGEFEILTNYLPENKVSFDVCKVVIQNNVKARECEQLTDQIYRLTDIQNLQKKQDLEMRESMKQLREMKNESVTFTTKQKITMAAFVLLGLVSILLGGFTFAALGLTVVKHGFEILVLFSGGIFFIGTGLAVPVSKFKGTHNENVNQAMIAAEAQYKEDPYVKSLQNLLNSSELPKDQKSAEFFANHFRIVLSDIPSEPRQIQNQNLKLTIP